ncbi:MAG: hydroxymethylglutaryl-CoA synthase [Acidimicrobiia bacterium]
MRGIVSSAAYLPYRRLDRTQIAPFVGQGGGKGTRTVASYDEDSTTMAVEAGRLALRGTGAVPNQLLFGTTFPAYADKTNATAVHAALRLPHDSLALDLGASVRSAVGGLLLALEGTGTSLVVSADVRTGLPGSGEEAAGGDGAAALVVGDDNVIAEFLGRASVSDEFVERWRQPGEQRTKVWDEKFSEINLVPLGVRAWNQALEAAGITANDVKAAAVSAPVARVAKSMGGKLDGVHVIDDLSATVGNTGAAQPALLLAALLEQAEPGQVVALVAVVLADERMCCCSGPPARWESYRPARADRRAGRGRWCAALRQVPRGGACCRWSLRRPEPGRISRPQSQRGRDWKFGFVGSKNPETGEIHMPPARVSSDGLRTDEMEPIAMADAVGTVVTFTIDRMAYSPSPPVVFAVVDFDGSGRLPIEAHRHRRQRGGDRAAGRDDVPEALRGRRHRQLLLEGKAGAQWVATASRTASPSSGWAAPTSSRRGTRASTTW